jgi:hypothetical protein
VANIGRYEATEDAEATMILDWQMYVLLRRDGVVHLLSRSPVAEVEADAQRSGDGARS